MPRPLSLLLALVWSLSTSAFALQVTGISPWVQGHTVRSLSPAEAQQEVFAGRADVALVRVPIRPPRGSARVLYTPVAVYPVVVAYNLPFDLVLTLQEVCDIFSGRVLQWSDLRTELPSLPIVSVTRLEPNAASWAVAQTCQPLSRRFQKIGLKSTWQGASVRQVKTLAEQQKALSQTGTLTLLVPENVPQGARVAQLQSWDLSLTPEKLDYGYDANPGEERFPGPFQALPQVNGVGVYPLRGVVWAVTMQEQAYRGRTRTQALQLQKFLQDLGGKAPEGVTLLPEEWRPFPRLYFQGKPLRAP